MKAIRGATTVESDTAEQIKASVSELLNQIKSKNNLSEENTVCILFSNTADIRSYYPAKAAREAGFFSCALFSSLEPEINGSLNNCIRVMVLAEIDRAPVHVYLKGAKNLRKDLSDKLNIAIDGPAGSGKSTISKILSKKLDILYLDTGAMYRTCALACVRAGANCADGREVEKVLKNSDISVRYENGAQVTLLNGEDVSDKIRTPEISMLASTVSAHKYVRIKMVDIQRAIAKGSSCVLDGRDIGTNVLPDADFKFFLTAAPEVRAERRKKENEEKGYRQSFDDILKEIILRDEQDKNREFAPLIKATDAVEVDTSNMTINEVADFITKYIQGRI